MRRRWFLEMGKLQNENYKWLSLRGTKQSVRMMKRSLKTSSRKLTDCFTTFAMTAIYNFLSHSPEASD
jgi:hypothetical protein